MRKLKGRGKKGIALIYVFVSVTFYNYVLSQLGSGLNVLKGYFKFLLETLF